MVMKNAFRVNGFTLVLIKKNCSFCIAQYRSCFFLFCFQLEKERYLMAELEKLQLELKPMEDIKAEIDRKSAQRTNIVVWGGLGYMAFQFGLLARLTWWEYSWDIMEPVTYFVGYGTAMACYAYFVLTRQVRNGHHRSCIHECLSNTFYFCFFFSGIPLPRRQR